MSELYEVEVLKKKGAQVSLRVQVVHPDSMEVPPSKTFAFNLLADTLFLVIGSRISAKQRKMVEQSPLQDEVTQDDMLNEHFVRDRAAAYIKSVKVTDKKNAPPPKARRDSSHPYWEDHKNWLSARMDIVTTHPAWAEHIIEGRKWDTASYDPGPAKKTKPALPGPKQPAGLSEDPVAGFVRIPVRKLMPEIQKTAKVASFLGRSYPSKCYAVERAVPVDDITPKLWKSWLGEPIELTFTKKMAKACGEQTRVIYPLAPLRKGPLKYVDWSGSSHGWGHILLDDVASAGRLRLKTNARNPNPKLSIVNWWNIGSSQLLHIEEKPPGKTFTLVVEALSPVEDVPRVTRGGILQLLIRQLEMNTVWVDHKERLGPKWQKIWAAAFPTPELFRERSSDWGKGRTWQRKHAAAFVESVTELSRTPPPYTEKQFAKLSDEKQREFWENPSFARVRAMVKLTDKKWVAHFRRYDPEQLHLHKSVDGPDWKGPPFGSEPLLTKAAEPAKKKRNIKKKPTGAKANKGAKSSVTGKTVVITGNIPGFPRKDAKRVLEETFGAKVTTSVSAKTDFVIVGEKPGSKLKEAEKRGIKTIDWSVHFPE